MIKTYLLVIIAALCNRAQAQNATLWRQYLKDSIFGSQNQNQVSLIRSSHNKSVNTFTYFFKNNNYFLASIYANTAVTVSTMLQPKMFQIVYDNYTILLRLAKYMQTNNKMAQLVHNTITDTTNATERIAIKYGSLFYNHYPHFTESNINTSPKKIASAMVVINQLWGIFTQMEKAK